MLQIKKKYYKVLTLVKITELISKTDSSQSQSKQMPLKNYKNISNIMGLDAEILPTSSCFATVFNKCQFI